MFITINNSQVEVLNGETLIETAHRIGHDIPSLCYAKDAIHKSSCMVCAVKDLDTGQIVPSCTTIPVKGMNIDTESEDVQIVRTLSLELLLSDHRADCEAPCSMVCPHGLDIERVMNLYDNGRSYEAYTLIAAIFALPKLGCDDCKVPCEKICRRKSVDKGVQIRDTIGKIVEMFDLAASAISGKNEKESAKDQFQSRLGRFTTREKEWLKENAATPSGCLHCACAGREGCKLRLYATAAGIRRPRYEASSALPLMKKQRVTEKMRYEPAKCIRCGLCVYNSNNGFTFKDRGFGMQVVIPDESLMNVGDELAKLCPTGALWIQI